MSPDTLHEGALLVADAHCAPWRTPFIDFLKSLESGQITTPQLILMGDVFDLLFGPIPETVRMNREGIEIINRLSEQIEIVYLEGNHDFALSKVFPNVKVIARSAQPWMARFEERTVALSHGDLHMGTGYDVYTALIRNRWILGCLNLIDRAGNGFIVRWLEKMMRRKNHCRTIEGFETVIAERLKGRDYRPADLLIEGHFHQNRGMELPEMAYFNLAAFACNERYFSVQSTKNQPLLREAVFHKEPL